MMLRTWRKGNSRGRCYRSPWKTQEGQNTYTPEARGGGGGASRGYREKTRPTRNGRGRHQRVCNELLRVRRMKGQKTNQDHNRSITTQRSVERHHQMPLCPNHRDFGSLPPRSSLPADEAGTDDNVQPQRFFFDPACPPPPPPPPLSPPLQMPYRKARQRHPGRLRFRTLVA